MKRKIFPYIPVIVLIILFLVVHIFPNIKKSIHSVLLQATEGISAGLYAGGQRIGSSFSFIGNISRIRKENAILVDRISELQIDEARIKELENENMLLKQELGFFDRSEIGSLVPARIIERDLNTYLDYIIVDKGESSGLKSGQAVVANGILVGQVKEVYDQNAKVVLITSKDSIIQAMLQDSRAKGILKGGIAGLFIDNIVSDTEYREGENIVTSGLGGKMREGLLIGRAGKIQSFSSGIFKSISVDPLAEFSKLELVFVEI